MVESGEIAVCPTTVLSDVWLTWQQPYKRQVLIRKLKKTKKREETRLHSKDQFTRSYGLHFMVSYQLRQKKKKKGGPGGTLAEPSRSYKGK